MFEINNPTNLIIARDALDGFSNKIDQKFENILIISIKELNIHVNKVIDAINKNSCSLKILFLENIEPTTELIDETAINLRNINYDLIIAVGGGSVIDLAKSLSIALTNPEPIWNYANLSNRPPSKLKSKPIPLVAIPTTSGTGSEVTPYAVLTKEDTKQKGTIQEPEIFPIMAIIDPEFLVTMPPRLTAYTGIDAFAHALESFINISKPSPFSEIVSAKSMELIFNNLNDVVKDGYNIDARLNMAWASSLAGIAISHRGTTTPHAIAEPLGALTKLPHAVTVYLCTMPVLKNTYPIILNKLNLLFKREGFKFHGSSKRNFIEMIENLFDEIGCNKKLKELIDVNENLISELLENVLKYKFRPLKQHPVEFDKKQLGNIIKEIITT